MMDGTVETIVTELRNRADPGYRDDLKPRYGIDAPTSLGVRMADLKHMAKTIGRDHALAQPLWDTGLYEARLLVALIADPARLTPAEMDRWRGDFGNWGICDTLCFDLFDRSPHALTMVDRWSGLNDEFGRRAAFALLASVALHAKKLPDAPFLERLPLIEAAASDSRNFVWKGVNWALRAIGRRSIALNLAAADLAGKLASSRVASERWVGKDALKALADPKARAKLGL
jgi:3-methyladenine DNA glycosylase AlkD